MFSKKTSLALFSMVVVLSVLAAQCGAPAGTPQTIVEKVVETVIVEKEGQTKVETVVVEKTVEVEKEVVKEVEVGALPAEETLFESTDGVGDVPTLDPSISEDTSSIQVVQELFGGPTHLDEVTGEVQPGMATEWEVSEDGLVYTFHLRDDVPWVKFDNTTGEVVQVTDDEGNPRIVNCNDFLFGIRRTLDPATASDYAYVNWIIKGAQEVSGGSDLADQDPLYGNLEEIGVQCLDDWTLEYTLNEAAAYFPAIANMWINYAQPQWVIENPDVGDRWIEAGILQSYGPYALREWTHDVSLTLQANPFWPGTDSIPKPSIKYINFGMLDQSAQLANYEAGLLDIADPPLPELDRIKADPVLSQELSTPGQLCTYYYGFNVTKPPFDDANVRKAFSWAIDRTAIVENVTKGGQIPARWFSRPGLTAAPDPAKGDDFGPPATADIEAAKEFLAASSYGSAEALPEITLMANQVEGHVVIAEAIQQMWNENLGVNVNLVTQEWAVFLDTLDTDPPQIWRLGWCLDYPDASNFARDVFRSDSGNNHTNWVNEEYDQIVDQAAFETDEQKRHDLYVQAEKMLVEDEAVMIPIYWYTNVDLTKPYVNRTYSTSGHETYEKWSLNK